MEVRIPHRLEAVELARRMKAQADKDEVEMRPAADGLSGVMSKDAGFLGRVEAHYSILPDALLVRVTERPSFLPEASLRRTIEEQLHKLVES